MIHPQLLDELITEANVVFAVSIVAIAKQLHRDTGELAGEFPCPGCHTGVVKWAVARHNGHASVLCSTTWQGDDGETYRCTSAME